MIGLRSFFYGILFFCIGSAAAADDLALPEPPRYVHPHNAVTVTEQVLATALFTGLVRRDAQGRIVPGLAESWTVNLTGQDYSFRLRSDAAFNRGPRIDAQMIVESLERALDPKTDSPFYALLLPIKNAEAFRLGTLAPDQKLGIAAPDKNTVIITLDRPSHRFLDVLASPIAAPFSSEPEAHNGNGPFTLAKMQNAYVLKRNNAPGAELEITADPNTANIALGFVAPVTSGGHPALYQLLANVRRAPLNDRNVRHALGMVIDRDALVTALQLPNAHPAYGLAADALQAPYAKLAVTDRKTVAEALLLDAPRDKPIRVVVPDQPLHRTVSAALSNAWAPLGFKVEVQTVPAADYERIVLEGAFDVAWMPPWAFGSSRADQLFPFSQAAGPWNAGGYREAAFDQFLASADGDLTPESRTQQWLRAEDLLVEDQPAWPLFFYSTTAPQTFDVTGWTGTPPQ